MLGIVLFSSRISYNACKAITMPGLQSYLFKMTSPVCDIRSTSGIFMHKKYYRDTDHNIFQPSAIKITSRNTNMRVMGMLLYLLKFWYLWYVNNTKSPVLIGKKVFYWAHLKISILMGPFSLFE